MSGLTYLGGRRGESFQREEMDQFSETACAALTLLYPEIRFNRVEISPMADHHLVDRPEVDIVHVGFYVSGRSVDLERHRFAHPSWWEGLEQGSRQGLKTEGFGGAYSIHRTRTGYRVVDGNYWDGIDRLIPVFAPRLLEKIGHGRVRP